jgi:hypothetical protein
MDLARSGIIIRNGQDARETDVRTRHVDDLSHRGGHRGVDGAAVVFQDLEPGVNGPPAREADHHPLLSLRQEGRGLMRFIPTRWRLARDD